MGLCDYADMFGKPGQGSHRYRLFDVAVVDVVLTLAAAYLMYRYDPSQHYLTYLILLMVLAIVLHRTFCVRTTFDKIIFGQ